MREPRIFDPVRRARRTDDDYVEFVRAGTRAGGSFECTACGHRIILAGELPACRVCGERLWEKGAWSPFAAALHDIRRSSSCSPTETAASVTAARSSAACG